MAVFSNNHFEVFQLRVIRSWSSTSSASEIWDTIIIIWESDWNQSNNKWYNNRTPFCDVLRISNKSSHLSSYPWKMDIHQPLASSLDGFDESQLNDLVDFDILL